MTIQLSDRTRQRGSNLIANLGLVIYVSRVVTWDEYEEGRALWITIASGDSRVRFDPLQGWMTSWSWQPRTNVNLPAWIRSSSAHPSYLIGSPRQLGETHRS